MRTIYLPVGDITVTLWEEYGTIHSDLNKKCAYCSEDGCYGDCDGSSGDIDGLESTKETDNRWTHNVVIDGLTSMILAHAIAGVDIETPAYIEGVERALQGCEEKFLLTN